MSREFHIEPVTGTFYLDMLIKTSTSSYGSTWLSEYKPSTRVLAYYDYLPFGGSMRQDANWNTEYRFTGQEREPEIGLYNYRARMYDPELGRFTSIDPAGQSAGERTSTSPLGPLSSRLVPQQAGRGEVRRLADRGEVIQPAGVHHADHH